MLPGNNVAANGQQCQTHGQRLIWHWPIMYHQLEIKKAPCLPHVTTWNKLYFWSVKLQWWSIKKYLSAILLNWNFSSIFLTACFVCRNKTINNILPRVLFGGLTAHIVLFEQARNVSTVEFSFFFCAFPRTTQPVQNTQLRYPLPLLFTDVRLCTVAAASRCHTRVDVTRWFCREATYSLASLLPTTPQDSIQSKSHNLTQWLS